MTTTRALRRTAAVLPAVAVLLSAPAAADVPESGDPPGTVFTDDPAIVAPHPLPVQSFSRGADPRVLVLHFSSGLPQCYGVHAAATETPAVVTVRLLGGQTPAAVGRMCPMVIVPGSVGLTLAGDLGDRAVLAA